MADAPARAHDSAMHDGGATVSKPANHRWWFRQPPVERLVQRRLGIPGHDPDRLCSAQAARPQDHGDHTDKQPFQHQAISNAWLRNDQQPIDRSCHDGDGGTRPRVHDHDKQFRS
jgi:hypothetical protein